MSEHQSPSETTRPVALSGSVPDREDTTWLAPPPPTPESGGPGPRPVKVAHLVLGLVFLGLSVVVGLASSGTMDGETVARWSPALLIIAGLAGLAASVAGQRRGQEEHDG